MEHPSTRKTVVGLMGAPAKALLFLQILFVTFVSSYAEAAGFFKFCAIRDLPVRVSPFLEINLLYVSIDCPTKSSWLISAPLSNKIAFGTLRPLAGNDYLMNINSTRLFKWNSEVLKQCSSSLHIKGFDRRTSRDVYSTFYEKSDSMPDIDGDFSALLTELLKGRLLDVGQDQFGNSEIIIR